MAGEEEHMPVPQPAESREEVKELTIDQLPEKFMFVETPEVQQVKELLVEAMATGGERTEKLRTQYEDMTEALCDQHTTAPNNTLARVGRDLASALIKRDAAARAAEHSKDFERELLYDYKDTLCDVSDLETSLVQVLGVADERTFKVIDAEIDRVFALVGRRQ
jgi:hypothetical protein